MTLQKKNTNDILYRLDYDDEQDDILLVAIKSNIPDYKMAYHLNKNLELKFHKVLTELSLTTENGINYFRHFKYDDEKNHLIWRLIENKSSHSISPIEQNNGLFGGESDLFNSTEYLVPEWKTIDFFLQIENMDAFFEQDLLQMQLEKVNNISTHFVVDTTSLSIKSQKNLIF